MPSVSTYEMSAGTELLTRASCSPRAGRNRWGASLRALFHQSSSELVSEPSMPHAKGAKHAKGDENCAGNIELEALPYGCGRPPRR